jgi:hypothetical protein
MKPEQKEATIMAFAHGEARVIVSKPSIMGYGLNLQHVCRRMVFASIDDSFESYYQAVRRCYRFGQNRRVLAHIITADTEGAVKANIARKQAQSDAMAAEMVGLMREITKKQIEGAKSGTEAYRPMTPLTIPAWILDNVEYAQ